MDRNWGHCCTLLRPPKTRTPLRASGPIALRPAAAAGGAAEAAPTLPLPSPPIAGVYKEAGGMGKVSNALITEMGTVLN